MWKDKPAFVAAFIMAGGFAAARYAPLTPLVWFTAALVSAAFASFALLRMRVLASHAARSSLSIPLCLFVASGLWYSASLEFGSDHISAYLHLGRPVRITADVVEEPVVRNGRIQVIVDVRSLAADGDSIGVEGRALLTVLQDTATFAYGDRIFFTAVPEEPPDTRNPGEVSYRDYLALNNVHAVMRSGRAQPITVIDKNRASWLFEEIVFPAKHFAARAIAETASGDERHYLTGLMLGNRSDLSRELQQAFANTGTVHVLAVSGSHVVVIVAAIYALFGMLRIPLRPKIAATIAAILFYMLLTGSTPSVVRASLMAVIVLAGKLIQRDASVYNCLGLSAVMIFLYDPKQVFDVGFQLSFGAVVSMVFCYPRMAALIRFIPQTTRVGRLTAAAAAMTAVSAAAQIGTIPFTAYYFEKVSVISLAANLVVVPLAGLNITLGFVGILFSIASTWVGSCFTEVNCLLSRFVLASVKASNQIPFAIVHTPSFGVKEAAVYVLSGALLFAVPRPHVFRRIALVLLLAADVILLADLLKSRSDVLRVTFFDVGQGDAVLFEFPGRSPVMIDAGTRSAAYDAGERIIVPGLRRGGIAGLSSVLITHAHDDHAGGLPAILAEMKTDRVIGSSLQSIAPMTAHGVQVRLPKTVRTVHRGDTIDVHPAARIYVLHPPEGNGMFDSADAYASVNNTSVVVRVCYGSVSLLLMGDAERSVEHLLVERYGGFLESTVIKIGHHGSGTSSSEELLRAVQPAEAVISVGRFNAFRHPSPGTLRRLALLGISAHRTDRDGAIVFETDGRELRRVRWREAARMRGIIH